MVSIHVGWRGESGESSQHPWRYLEEASLASGELLPSVQLLLGLQRWPSVTWQTNGVLPRRSQISKTLQDLPSLWETSPAQFFVEAFKRSPRLICCHQHVDGANNINLCVVEKDVSFRSAPGIRHSSLLLRNVTLWEPPSLECHYDPCSQNPFGPLSEGVQASVMFVCGLLVLKEGWYRSLESGAFGHTARFLVVCLAHRTQCFPPPFPWC